MPKTRILLTLLVALTPTQLLADIAAIHKDALPQSPAVLQAYNDAAQMEPFSRAWTQNWTYPVSKKEVAQRLSNDMDVLESAVKANPKNAELLLLAGLVAHYAYNVDVEAGHDKSLDAFNNAEHELPADVRPKWFHAGVFCQTKETRAGMEEMLAIENSQPWQSLPADFWDDYMECASVNNMPAHTLRAADHLQKMHAAPSDMRTFLAVSSQKRFDAFDPARVYKPGDAWYGIRAGDNIVFTSTICGVQFTVPGNWQVDRLDLTNGSCIADFSTPGYKAVDKELRPSVMLLVQRPQKGETLADYAKRFTRDGTFQSFTPSRCPSDQCIAFTGVQPGMYKENGDGHGRLVLFEREAPEFPGLLFETPAGFPQTNASGSPQYFRPSQFQARIPGKLFYLVLLDTASSIEASALKDYEFFLQHLVVE